MVVVFVKDALELGIIFSSNNITSPPIVSTFISESFHSPEFTQVSALKFTMIKAGK